MINIKWLNLKNLSIKPSLRNKLIGFMLLQSVTISLLVSIFSYYSSSISMQQHSIGFSTEILSTKTYQVEEYLRRSEQYSQDILYDNSIYTLLKETKDFNHKDLFADNNKMDILEKWGYSVINLFSKSIMSRVEIQSLALLDNNGEVWVSQDDNSKDFNISDFLDMQTFEKMKNSISNEESEHLYIQEQNGIAENIFYVRRLSSPDTYEPLGYFVMLADFDYFNSILASSEEQQGYSLILITDDETILYQADESIKEDVLRYLDSNNLWQVDEENDVLYTRGNIGTLEWTMIAVQDLAVLFRDTVVLRNTLILIMIFAIIAFTLLSITMARDILKPVQRLINSMKRVQSGETGVNVKVDRQDELGYMSKTFNSMICENEMLVRSIYRAEITKKDAELQALQAQINPHFLYNTLESISWRARLSGVSEISEMVEDLAELMEAGVGKSEECIPLSTEIEYIQTYLRLMKRRFEDRLKTRINVDESLLEYKVPRLLVQPLIENAIYHGIDKSSKGGFIELSAKKDGCCLIITVTNSGKPISDSEIKRLNEQLSMDSDEYFFHLRENQRNNVGIENVNRRIKLYFGEEYGLKISKNDKLHTVVTATLRQEGMDEV